MSLSPSIRKIQFLTIVIFSLCLLQTQTANGCIQFSSGNCLRCDPSYHLYSGRCYKNLVGCLRYQNGEKCVQCDSSFSKLINGKCDYSQTPLTLQTQQKISQLHLYDGTQGQQYGQSNFRPISIEQAKSMKTFQVLDNFVRTGEYRHRISSTQNPVFSVYTYQKDGRQSFKILYDGTGGAVILCIGDVDQNTLHPTIRSIVVISVHQIIDYCSLYDERQSCIRCVDGYHLQNNRCYLSVGGCVSYRKNICIKCEEFYLLIENRCVSDCPSVSDCRSAFFYGISQSKSTIQVVFGDNIYQERSFTNSSSSSSSGVIVLNTTKINDNTQITTTIRNSSSSSSSITINPGSGTTTTTTTTTTTSSIPDPNCRDYDFDKRRCDKCSPFYYLNKFTKKCTAVSPFCETYSEDDGGCLTCYPGFTKSGKECVFT